MSHHSSAVSSAAHRVNLPTPSPSAAKAGKSNAGESFRAVAAASRAAAQTSSSVSAPPASTGSATTTAAPSAAGPGVSAASTTTLPSPALPVPVGGAPARRSAEPPEPPWSTAQFAQQTQVQAGEAAASGQPAATSASAAAGAFPTEPAPPADAELDRATAYLMGRMDSNGDGQVGFDEMVSFARQMMGGARVQDPGSGPMAQGRGTAQPVLGAPASTVNLSA